MTRPRRRRTSHVGRLLIPLLLAAAALAGCGDDEGGGKPTGDLGGAIVYTRSGGIAGMPLKLTIEPDGYATVEARIEGDRASFELDADQLDRLHADLEAADLDSVGIPPGPAECADCFIYGLTYAGTTISYDEVDTVPDAVRSVVGELDRIATERLPDPAASAPKG